MGICLVATPDEELDSPNYLGLESSVCSWAVIELAGKWIIPTPNRVRVEDQYWGGAQYILIENMKLLEDEAPTDLDAFLAYMKQNLPRYTERTWEKFDHDYLAIVRDFIAKAAALGEDVFVR